MPRGTNLSVVWDDPMYDHKGLYARMSAAMDRQPGASLATLANGLRIHRQTAGTVIRRHSGMRFVEWRAARQATVACTLLRTRPELSIKEIATAAGFSSTSVLDHFLRRRRGLAPSAFREGGIAWLADTRQSTNSTAGQFDAADFRPFTKAD
jgi:methylphosphotriester-DNA--protein-cysteine methyltransferase